MPPSGREVARVSVTEGERVLCLLVLISLLPKAPPPVYDGSPLSEGAIGIMLNFVANNASL